MSRSPSVKCQCLNLTIMFRSSSFHHLNLHLKVTQFNVVKNLTIMFRSISFKSSLKSDSIQCFQKKLTIIVRSISFKYSFKSNSMQCCQKLKVICSSAAHLNLNSIHCCQEQKTNNHCNAMVVSLPSY